MNKQGTIIIIEDDEEDRMILGDVLEEVLAARGLENKVFFIEESSNAVKILKETNAAPFLLFSDINMPKLNGFELRDQIKEDEILSYRTIPYIFLTTVVDHEEYIKKAYSQSIQGFFSKPTDFKEYIKLIGHIIDYWMAARVPPKS